MPTMLYDRSAEIGVRKSLFLKRSQLLVVALSTLFAVACSSSRVHQAPALHHRFVARKERISSLRLRGGSADKDYYEVLGVQRDCTAEVFANSALRRREQYAMSGTDGIHGGSRMCEKRTGKGVRGHSAQRVGGLLDAFG